MQEQDADCILYALMSYICLLFKVRSSLVSTALLQATELKRLQNALGIAQSELRKVQEQYAECNKYCAFLDSITPHEFFLEQAARYEAEWQVRF